MNILKRCGMSIFRFSISLRPLPQFKELGHVMLLTLLNSSIYGAAGATHNGVVIEKIQMQKEQGEKGAILHALNSGV